MQQNPPLKKSQPVTFRLDESSISALKEEAASKNQSLNSAMTQIVKEYLDCWRHMDKFDGIVLSKSIFKSILEMLNHDQCITLAEQGVTQAIEFIQFVWGQKNTFSTTEFLKMYLEHFGYGKYNFVSRGENYQIIIRHGLGKKGSLLIGMFMRGLFDHPDIKEVKIIESDASVNIEIIRK